MIPSSADIGSGRAPPLVFAAADDPFEVVSDVGIM